MSEQRPPSPIGIDIPPKAQQTTPQQEAAQKKQEDEKKTSGTNPTSGYDEASKRAERAAKAERDPADKIIQEQIQRAKDTPGSQSSKISINRDTGEVKIQETSREIRSNVPQRQYTTEYADPLLNQEFGNQGRVGDILRKQQIARDAELARAKNLSEFGDVLKRQTTKEVITTESANQFMKDYGRQQLSEINARKGAPDAGIATTKKGGTIVEEITYTGEIVGRPTPRLQKQYFVNIGNEQVTYENPDVETPKGGVVEGFTNYFTNIPKSVQQTGERFILGKSDVKLEPEVEGSAIGSLIGLGSRAVGGQRADVNLLLFSKEIGDVGRQFQKNPAYGVGSLLGTTAFTAATFGFGPAVKGARYGLVAGSRIIERAGDIGKIGLETSPLRFAYSPTERGLFGRYVLGKSPYITSYTGQGKVSTVPFRMTRTEEFKVVHEIPQVYPTKPSIASAAKDVDEFRPFSSDNMITPIAKGRQVQITTTKQIEKQVERATESQVAKEIKQVTEPVKPTTIIKTEIKEVREVLKPETTLMSGKRYETSLSKFLGTSGNLGLGGITGVERVRGKKQPVNYDNTVYAYPPSEAITNALESGRGLKPTSTSIPKSDVFSIPKSRTETASGLKQSGITFIDQGLRQEAIPIISPIAVSRTQQGLRQDSLLKTNLQLRTPSGNPFTFTTPPRSPPPTDTPVRFPPGFTLPIFPEERKHKGKRGKRGYKYTERAFKAFDIFAGTKLAKQFPID